MVPTNIDLVLAEPRFSLFTSKAKSALNLFLAAIFDEEPDLSIFSKRCVVNVVSLIQLKICLI